jgi:hypothetical protein
MKPRLLRPFALLLAGLAAVATAQSADPAPSRYLYIGYHKPLPGKADAYVRMERESWKRIHQARVDAGIIRSWKMYVVSFPNGDAQEYDYVTITEFPSWAAMEEPYRRINFDAILGEAKVKELGTINALRKLVRKDTVEVVHATDNFLDARNNVVSVHFLKALPGGAARFMRVQREYFHPLNAEISKASQGASGWAATVVRYPDNADFAYSHVSFNTFVSLAQMESDAYAEIQRKWSAKLQELSPLLPESRKRIRNELWRLIDQTQPK